jgi:glycosyltransferase involved in cell wall biosynthesis
MNILELCLSPSLGGLELYAFRSSLALSGNHHVISVIVADGKLAGRYAEHPELEVRHFHYSRSYLPLLNARRLAALIDAHDIDVLHMHWGNDLALAALAKTLSAKKPRLVYTRQMLITRMKDDSYHRFLYRRMDRMLTITRALERSAQHFIPDAAMRITTLYYGVKSPSSFLDTETIAMQRANLGFDTDDFVAGLFGRLEHGKGQHLLIEALATAKNDGIDMKALLVGHEMTPGYTGALQRLADELGVGDSIRFSGFVPDPQALMQLCDCVVLATFEETFGLVLPEAMRAGVAVVGSNAGGVPEIIEHEQTGLLFESRDARSLYAQLARLYTQPELKQRLAAHGKRRADEDFNDHKHFDELERHFTSLLGGH